MDPRGDTSDLMARAKAGDREAFHEAVEPERPRLLAFIRARLGPRLRLGTDPEDVFQETLLRALRSLDRFEWKGEGSLFAWLGSISEYLIRDLGRAEKRMPRGAPLRDLPAGDPSPSKVLRRAERFDRLEDALKALSPDHREVIRLARFEDLPVEEIARRMDRSPGAVRHLLIRALAKLRETFGETESLNLPDRKFWDEEAAP